MAINFSRLPLAAQSTLLSFLEIPEAVRFSSTNKLAVELLKMRYPEDEVYSYHVQDPRPIKGHVVCFNQGKLNVVFPDLSIPVRKAINIFDAVHAKQNGDCSFFDVEQPSRRNEMLELIAESPNHHHNLITVDPNSEKSLREEHFRLGYRYYERQSPVQGTRRLSPVQGTRRLSPVQRTRHLQIS